MTADNFNEHIKDLENDIHFKYKDLSQNKQEVSSGNKLFLHEFQDEKAKAAAAKTHDEANFKELVIKLSKQYGA